MPSRTSRKPKTSTPRPKSAPGCSEALVAELATELAAKLRPGDRVFLEGELGAGKTTFARAMLQALSIDQPAEGSPTFPIAHEYAGDRGEVIHVDFYRIRKEAELEEAGIMSYFWERQAVVICEWISLFPRFRESVIKSCEGRVYRVGLSHVLGRPEVRDVRIEVAAER